MSEEKKAPSVVKIELTPSEKHIWESAYATAFVSTYQSVLGMAYMAFLSSGEDKSAARNYLQHEAHGAMLKARLIANDAVIQLRRDRERDEDLPGAPAFIVPDDVVCEQCGETHQEKGNIRVHIIPLGEEGGSIPSQIKDLLDKIGGGKPDAN
jgi:hypothetical protein